MASTNETAALLAARRKGLADRRQAPGQTPAQQPPQPAGQQNAPGPQFYQDSQTGIQMSPVMVCVCSLAFMFSVVFLHICNVVYRSFSK